MAWDLVLDRGKYIILSQIEILSTHTHTKEFDLIVTT